MAVLRADERMRDLMQDRVEHLVVVVQSRARRPDADLPLPEPAHAGSCLGPVGNDGPVVEPVLMEEPAAHGECSRDLHRALLPVVLCRGLTVGGGLRAADQCGTPAVVVVGGCRSASGAGRDVCVMAVRATLRLLRAWGLRRGRRMTFASGAVRATLHRAVRGSAWCGVHSV